MGFYYRGLDLGFMPTVMVYNLFLIMMIFCVQCGIFRLGSRAFSYVSADWGEFSHCINGSKAPRPTHYLWYRVLAIFEICIWKTRIWPLETVWKTRIWPLTFVWKTRIYPGHLYGRPGFGPRQEFACKTMVWPIILTYLCFVCSTLEKLTKLLLTVYICGFKYFRY